MIAALTLTSALVCVGAGALASSMTSWGVVLEERFESDRALRGRWQVAGRNTRVRIDSTLSHGGRACLCVEDQGHDTGQVATSRMPVVPGSVYRFCAYVRRQAGNTGDAELDVVYRDSQGEFLRQLPGQRIKTDNVWVRVSNLAVIPDDARFMSLRFRPARRKERASQPASGTAYLDDLVLEQLAQAPPHPQTSRESPAADVVPPPWTPLHVTGGMDPARSSDLVARCWGREYVFSGSALPKQIVALNRPLLSGPMALEVDGRPVAATPCRHLKTKPGWMQFDSATERSGLVVEQQARLEFDGLLRIRIRLCPRSFPHELGPVRLRLELDADVARYFYRAPRRGSEPAWEPVEPDRQPKRLPLPATPYIWIGDDERGLCWFTESTAGWSLREPTGAIQLARDSDRVALCISMVDQRVPLRGPVTFELGIQATPSRPRPEGWRSFHVLHFGAYPEGWRGEPLRPLQSKVDLAEAERAGVKRITLHLWWARPILSFEPIWPEDLRRFIRAAHQRGIKVALYVSPGLLAESTLNTVPGAFSWLRRPSDRFPDYRGAAAPYVAWTVCPRSGLRAYVLRGLAKLLDTYAVDGIYWDVAMPFPCRNASHGCGYEKKTPEGTVRLPTVPFFASRSLFREAYALVHQKRPSGSVTMHASYRPFVPLMFADLFLDGENAAHTRCSVLAHRGPITEMPLEFWRMQLRGHRWGPAPEYCMYKREGHPKHLPNGQQVLYALLHDVAVHEWDGATVMPPIWRALDAFQTSQAEFTGYWQLDAEATSQPDAVKVSLYRRGPDALAIVGNVTGRDLDVRVDLTRVGIDTPANRRLIDALSGKPLEPSPAGTLLLRMPAYTYRLIRVTPTRPRIR